jgi:lysophospholipase
MSFDGRSIPLGGTFDHIVMRDGWRVRRFRQKPDHATCGSILWLGGRADIVEKYFEAINGWVSAGWSVTSFDWRGQGGSGRVSANRAIGHIGDFSIWVDDLAEIFATWVQETPAPHIVIGHSMGGHLALRALAERRIAPNKMVLVAPMLGFATRRLPFWLAKAVATIMAWFSTEIKPAWARNERPAPPDASRQQYLTHDLARYDDEIWWKDTYPDLALGPPSWTWLAAAYRSMSRLRLKGAIERIMVPVLILSAEHDALVDPAITRRFAERLPTAEIMLFGPESAHEILREADPVRNRALAAIARFTEE